MKRIALLFLASGAMFVANAQTPGMLSLSGSSYTQNFNSLSSGLPTGWHVFNAGTATSLGVIYDTSSKLTLTPVGTTTAWKNTAGGYKNYASANNATSWSPLSNDTASQTAATDRALGVRQVGNTSSTFPGSDSGATFALLINNTTGLTNFSMTFKLQSLDSSSTRTTTWRVDYGVGLIPTTFTTASTTGTVTTGGNTYSNNLVSVNFSTGLNNISGPVWIRIWAATPTTGTGNRASSSIDDVTLNWTGTATTGPRPNIVMLTPANNATNVSPSTTLSIVFDKQVTRGTGNIYVKNRNTQVTKTIAVSSSDVTVAGGYLVTISNLNLQSNATYHVMFDSTCFDTAGYRSSGIYDSTSWKFTTNNTAVGNMNAATLDVHVVNPAANGNITILCSMPHTAALTARVYDLNGREVAAQSFNATKGENRMPMHTSLPAGSYIIRVDDGKEWGSAKVTMQ